MKRKILDIKPLCLSCFLLTHLLYTSLFVLIMEVFIYFTMKFELGNSGFPFFIGAIIWLCICSLSIIFILIPPVIYINTINVNNNNELHIKWQRNWKYYERVILVKKISMEMVPAGMNNPYLKLTILAEDNEKLTLKQYSFKEWNKKLREKVYEGFRLFPDVETELKEL